MPSPPVGTDRGTMLGALRYRTKITLAFSLLALLGVVSLSAVFLYTGYEELRSNRIATGLRMSSCLASNLARDVSRDALYPVFETLQRFSGGWAEEERPQTVVLDARHRVYATTRSPPRDYLARPLASLGPEYARLLERIEHLDGSVPLDSPRGYFALAPLMQGGERVGTLLVDFPLDSLRTRSWRLFQLMIGYGVLLLAFLWLIGWVVGRRMVRPLLSLSECLRRIGQGDLGVRCELGHSRDEFAELGRGFSEMVRGLREKEALKSQMVHAERLAAIGRMSAGMAHEINNPLGGMLNAISTYRKHGDNPEVAHKTLDLLDRGLAQLRNTVQALLVNARLEDRALTGQDLRDLRTLVEPQMRRRGLRLQWSCDIEEPSGVPASQVRQVLMNLLLNAIQATPEGGRIELGCSRDAQNLLLTVEDDGPGIPPELRAHLFEPFVDQAQGTGLGLWVSFQIVTGLGGSIEALDLQPGTRFVVRLPRGGGYVKDTDV